MRKVFSCLLLLCFLQVSAGGYAQRLSLSARNASFEKVMEDIRTQTGYNFFYVKSHLRNAKPITVSVSNVSLKEAMDAVCKDQPVTYEIRDRVVIIKKRDAADPARLTIADQRVTGQVTGEGGRPLAGVSIRIKGTSVGVVTAEDGRFFIDAPENGTLEFSYVGYITREVKINATDLGNIQLVPGDKNLDEIVVVGFGVQKKVNLTGAVDMITSKQLESRPIANLGAGLQGLIPNLNITISNGRATTNPNFNIRGFTSINGGDPLIIVDNIPYTMAEVARINPNDVETVSVLKDAAAGAIYGARASFGVVLITTKKAKGSKLNVALNAMVGYRSLGKLPDFITDPYEVMDIKNEAGKPLYNLYPEAAREYAKKRSEDPSLPAVIISPTNANNWAYYGSTDWLKEAYNNSAPTYNANLSISKRSDKLSYYFSGDYYRQDGLLKFGNDTYKRYNVRGKIDFDVTRWLRFSNNTLLTSTDYEAPVSLDGDFFWNVNRTNSLDVPKNPDGSWTSAGASVLGVLQEGGRRRDKLNEFLTTFSAKAALIENVWDFNADATFRRGSGLIRSYDVPVAYKTGPNNPVQYTFANTGTWAQDENTTTAYNVFNIYTDFHKNFGAHYLQALVGFNQEYFNYNNFWTRRTGLISPSLPSVATSTGTVTNNETIRDWAVQGVFSRLAYNYREKYLLELNSRYDGSSRFPSGKRWGYFPSASAGWVLSQERFFEPVKQALALDLFKLRGSYGTLGNQASVSEYGYIPTMSNGQVGYILGTGRPQAVYAPGAVSDNFSWESIATVNLGIDLALLRNRLSVNFDKYTRYTNDMLIAGKTLPAVFGTAVPQENAGDLKTKGWELRVNWRDNGELAGSPFWYNLALTLADSRSWITRFDNPTKSLGGSFGNNYVGREIGEIWGADIIGFFKDAADITNSPNQTAMGTDDQSYKFYPGDPKFADRNGDGKVDMGKKTVDDPGDMHIIGNNRARLPYSADLSAGWKGVDLRIFVQGIGKRDWYPGASNIYFWGVFAQPWTNPTVQNGDYWTPDNPDAYFPAVRAYSAEDGYQQLGIPNKRYLQNGAYMRVKNVTLGYTLPQTLLRKAGLDKVRFYVSAENIFEISHIKVKLDPESLGDGNRPQAAYPFQRTYSFGVNMNF
ncbi:SusC/RagA family TonB-linked outer membrane protein [Niabella pedocola]|uniref:SusC/RagA family TonB-linked outer membrane protein n=1 Tax=Niabella pedocola TaxID=1752077 RepID=A0ABS8PNF1_9BACT|nr:SusC/RagA family TonB-linked outer membrane protein [Niabella pedocola]MCD2422634.1 SusC/RagA family TonB-linked outer membrane protein [Niabella pedocola]